jgi:hypothetical protein
VEFWRGGECYPQFHGVMEQYLIVCLGTSIYFTEEASASVRIAAKLSSLLLFYRSALTLSL